MKRYEGTIKLSFREYTPIKEMVNSKYRKSRPD